MHFQILFQQNIKAIHIILIVYIINIEKAMNKSKEAAVIM